MAKCNYPNCWHKPAQVPVIELPAIKLSTGERTGQVVTLIGEPLCLDCCAKYNFNDWMKPSEWADYVEQAREKGLQMPKAELLTIQFKPIGWRPGRTFEVIK